MNNTNRTRCSKTFFSVFVTMICGLGIVGCEIEQTEPGELPSIDADVESSGQLPKYEVRQTQEGRLPDVDVKAQPGKLPELEVETADVEVETDTVEVPVPDIDVEMPGEDEPRTN